MTNTVSRPRPAQRGGKAGHQKKRRSNAFLPLPWRGSAPRWVRWFVLFPLAALEPASTISRPTFWPPPRQHLSAATKRQALVDPFQFRVLAHRDVSSFDQQPAHHAIALFADVAQALLATAAVLGRIQPQITSHLLAARKPLGGSQR